MYKKDGEFRNKVKNGKGFCLPHFGDLCDAAETRLNDKEKAEFYPMLFTLMEENMKRLSDDVAWLVEKFDYRNQAADWKTPKTRCSAECRNWPEDIPPTILTK